jgi:hypothetical protein
MTRRRQGVLEDGPILSSEDLGFAGKSPAEIYRLMTQHVLTHGIGSNLLQFLEKAEALAGKIDAGVDSLAASTAVRLIYDIQDLRMAVLNGIDPRVLLVAVTAGLGYASLVIDGLHGKTVDARFRGDKALAKNRHVPKRKVPESAIRAVHAKHMSLKQEAQELGVPEGTAKDYRKKFR